MREPRRRSRRTSHVAVAVAESHCFTRHHRSQRLAEPGDGDADVQRQRHVAAVFIRAAEPSDWPEIEWLLVDAGLALAGAREVMDRFFVVESDGTIVACGFRPVERNAIPPSVKGSIELRGACPSTATIMMKEVR